MSRNLMKPTEPVRLILTARDATIIRALYRYRFLTTDQIQVLTDSTSRSKLNDRLRDLWAAGYLDRPELQRTLFAYADRRPTVHALGDAGAQWLTDNHGITFPKSVDWRAKNKNIKAGDFLIHTLGVTETMLGIERELGVTDGLRLIDRDEVWQQSPHYNPRALRPFELPTTIPLRDGTQRPRATQPDYLFGIVDARGGHPSRGLHFLEYDRGTEAIHRSSMAQSSILQKLYGYADAYQRKLHEARYGYKNFRVLFVVEGDWRRIDAMIDVYQARCSKQIPAGALLFTTTSDLAASGFLAPVWRNGRRETLALLRPDVATSARSSPLVPA